MTRDDVKKIFPEATDEQITAYLNAHNDGVNKAKASGAEKLKELEEFQRKAAEYDAKKTELEKLTASAQEMLENNAKALNRTKVCEIFSKANVTDYEKLLDSIVSTDEAATLAKATAYAEQIEHERQKVKDELSKLPPPPTGGGDSGKSFGSQLGAEMKKASGESVSGFESLLKI